MLLDSVTDLLAPRIREDIAQIREEARRQLRAEHKQAKRPGYRASLHSSSFISHPGADEQTLSTEQSERLLSPELDPELFEDEDDDTAGERMEDVDKPTIDIKGEVLSESAEVADASMLAWVTGELRGDPSVRAFSTTVLQCNKYASFLLCFLHADRTIPGVPHGWIVSQSLYGPSID